MPPKVNKMKEQDRKELLKELSNKLSDYIDGYEISLDYLIDFKNGEAINIYDIEKYEDEYIDISLELDTLIAKNNLDDVQDYARLCELCNEEYLKYLEGDQFIAIDFDKFVYLKAEEIASK